MIAKPVRYTPLEGGEWLPWQPYFPTLTNLNLVMNARPRPWVIFGPNRLGCAVQVHAIEFDTGRVWDTVNGWRDGDQGPA